MSRRRLSAIRPQESINRKALSREDGSFVFCRCCCDHLAGQVGAALACGLQARGFIVGAEDKQFQVAAEGIEWIATIGLDVHTLKPTKQFSRGSVSTRRSAPIVWLGRRAST
jgi:hypothetical protein